MNLRGSESHDRDRGESVWSDELLERLLDGDLNDDLAATLRDELRQSPEARRELAEIRRTDALAAQLLDGIIDGRLDRVAEAMEVYQRRAARRICAGAACLALLIGGAFLLGRHAASPSRGAAAGSHLAAAPSEVPLVPPGKLAIAPDSPRAVRTVFEMPVRPKHPTPAPDAGTGVASEPDRLARAPESTPEPRAESPRVREHRFLALGRTLRSADVAKQTLDAMPASEQLEACRVWARDPSLRPVAFERLAKLQNDPALAGECARIASEMSDDRFLLAWARSHGLRTTFPEHQ